MSVVKITPSEYASLRGISLSAVTKQLRTGVSLTGVIKVEKFSRFYLLTVKLDSDGKLVIPDKDLISRKNRPSQ